MENVERRARKYIFDYFLESMTAPSLAEVALYLGVPVPAARSILVRLDEAHQIKLLDGTDRILMAFPFSAIATPYRVTRGNGRRYFANCAWDSIAFHPMLEEPIRIDSFCDHCGEPIGFRIESGHGVLGERELPLVQLRLPASEWWKDITRTCANTMVYLAAESHAPSDPLGREPQERGIVTVDQVVRMSIPIYGGKLRLEYERPPPEVIRAAYASVGLTGPHWQL